MLDGNDSEGSSCHMTLEEESKYLESSGDEDEIAVNQVFCQTRLVSENVNNLITIKFSNKENASNSITETMVDHTKKNSYLETDSAEAVLSTTNRHFGMRRGKKRKIPRAKGWNVSFMDNNYNSTQFCLNDIGYESFSEDDENVETANITTVKITCGDNQHRICEEIQESIPK